MNAVLLLLLPTIGLLLLAVVRLWDREPVGERSWRTPVGWIAMAVAIGLLLFAAGVAAAAVVGFARSVGGLVENFDARSQGESPALVVAAVLLLAIAIVCVALGLRRPDGRDRLSVAGWLMLLGPLVYAGGLLALPLVPVLLIMMLVGHLRRLRSQRLLTVVASYLSARVPLDSVASPEAVPPDERTGTHRQLAQLADNVRAGLPLSEALEYSGKLPVRITETVRAAESSGDHLPAAVQRLADEEAQRNSIGGFRHLAGTVLYLWAVLNAAMLIVGFVGYYLVPKFKHIFGDFGLELPPLFRVVVDAMDSTVTGPGTSLALFQALLMGAIVATTFAIRGTTGWSGRWLRMAPKRVAGGHVMRTLAEPLLVGRPVEPVVERLQLAAADEYWQNVWGLLLARLRNGEPLADAMRSMKLISDRERAAIRSSRRFDAAGLVMMELGSGRDARVQRAGFAVASVLRVASMIVLGLLVAAFALGCFTVITRLINSLS